MAGRKWAARPAARRAGVRGEPRDRVGDRGVELGGRAVEPHHHLPPHPRRYTVRPGVNHRLCYIDARTTYICVIVHSGCRRHGVINRVAAAEAAAAALRQAKRPEAGPQSGPNPAQSCLLPQRRVPQRRGAPLGGTGSPAPSAPPSAPRPAAPGRARARGPAPAGSRAGLDEGGALITIVPRSFVHRESLRMTANDSVEWQHRPRLCGPERRLSAAAVKSPTSVNASMSHAWKKQLLSAPCVFFIAPPIGTLSAERFDRIRSDSRDNRCHLIFQTSC